MEEHEITGASPSSTGLSQAEPQERLVPPGFDPSRMDKFDDTDWHVLAQDIANYWSHPEERAVAYQAAGEAIKLLRVEMDRRDENERRNCLNWGPCSRHDGRMAETECNPSKGFSPCPFCAGQAGFVIGCADDGRMTYTVFCDGCHASAATEFSRRGARRNWNRRRDSDGSPKGGDGEAGSVACDDSAGPKDIAQSTPPTP